MAFRTVTFQSILEGIAALFNDSPDSVNAGNASRWTRFINERVRTGQEFDYWPELTPCEERKYRLDYNSATSYAAPTATAASEVYFPATQAYYQALKAASGQAPATLTGTGWVLNSAYWAACTSSYSGADWAASTAYAVEAVVRNTSDGRFYACHTAHTSSSTFDATKFGILTPFEAYVALDQTGQTPIGEVLRVTRNDPRVNRRFPGLLAHVLSDKGIVPGPGAPVRVFVEFRRRVPRFTMTAWNSGTAYAVGDLVYSATTGECYEAIQAGTNQVVTLAAYWRKQDMPYVLKDYVIRGAFGDALRPEGKHNEADRQDGKALEFLLQAHDAAFAGQGQFDTAAVQTY